MDVLDKIKKLQNEKGWSTYQLSIESGITLSTLTNMFSRNTCPKVDTLEKICDAFNITLSDFFLEKQNTVHLNKDESELINGFRVLNNKEKEAVKSLIYVLKKKE